MCEAGEAEAGGLQEDGAWCQKCGGYGVPGAVLTAKLPALLAPSTRARRLVWSGAEWRNQVPPVVAVAL